MPKRALQQFIATVFMTQPAAPDAANAHVLDIPHSTPPLPPPNHPMWIRCVNDRQENNQCTACTAPLHKLAFV